jgi:hypothetical protein
VHSLGLTAHVVVLHLIELRDPLHQDLDILQPSRVRHVGLIVDVVLRGKHVRRELQRLALRNHLELAQRLELVVDQSAGRRAPQAPLSTRLQISELPRSVVTRRVLVLDLVYLLRLLLFSLLLLRLLLLHHLRIEVGAPPRALVRAAASVATIHFLQHRTHRLERHILVVDELGAAPDDRDQLRKEGLRLGNRLVEAQVELLAKQPHAVNQPL